MKTEALKRVEKARAQLVMSQPFFGALALAMPLVERPDVETMAVDGRNMFYAPAFVLELGERELVGVVAHEVMHCAYMHHTRRRGRDLKLWNVATDYAINRDLRAAGFILPAGALFNSKFDGLGAEAIYSALAGGQQPPQSGGQPQQAGSGQQGGQSGGNGQPQPGGQKPGAGEPGGNGGKQGPQPGQGGQPGAGGQQTGNGSHPGDIAGNDPGGCGGVIDAAPDHDAASLAEIEVQWQARVRQAVAVAKAHAGKVPGELAELVESLNRPRVSWREVLRRFIDDSASRDYSWTRPNRRHIGRGVILPGFVPDRPTHIVIAVDTSGSVSAAELAAFRDEIQAILDDGAADAVTVVQADTRVHGAERYESGEPVTMTARGRGGTSFVQPFQWIAENVPDASAVVYATDMDCGGAWGEQPGAPVLWLVTGDPRRAARYAAAAPFGESILLDDIAA